MLRPVTTNTTLRELLEEQRAALDRARVMPSSSYLTKIEPVVPRSASADLAGNDKGAKAPPRRLARSFAGNSRLHDVASELADIAEERSGRLQTSRMSDDERGSVERLLEKMETLEPELFQRFRTPAAAVAATTAATLSEAVGASTTTSPSAAPATGGVDQPQPAVPPLSTPQESEDKIDTSAVQSPAAGTPKSQPRLASFRFSKQIKKLQAVSHTPEVYRSMVQSRDAMLSLFNFATQCSEARLGSDEVLKVMEAGYRNTAGADLATIYSRGSDGWERGVGHEFLMDTMTQSAVFAVPPDLDDIVKEGKVMRDKDRIIIPIKADGVAIAAAEIMAPTATLDDQLLENMSRIAGMFIRNNNSFLESKWQRRQAEAMLQMARQLSEETLEEERLARGIMNFTTQLIEADTCCLFLVGEDGKIARVFTESSSGDSAALVEAGRSIAELVVETPNIINIDDAHADNRFDKSTDQTRGRRTGSLLSVPVFFEGRIVAVQQLLRDHLDNVTTAFSGRDIELMKTFTTFVGVCLRNCRVNAELLREQRKSEAILHVVRDMNNTDIRDVQSVVAQILAGARRLLTADRATLFLVDKERNELYSKIADDTDGQVIRFPIGRGIAGTVAKLGSSENIPDAYADPRFNKAFDVSLGYVTKSMLTEAIFFQDEVIAVAQLVNKIESDGTVGIFTRRDEETFRAFSLFAGISLRNSHLLNFAIDAGREAMELQELREGRRAKGRQEAVLVRNDISEAVVSHIVTQIDLADAGIVDVMASRDFNLFDIREQMSNCFDVAVKLVIELAKTQGYLDEFNCPVDVFARFVLACRDKYRNVPYHNFYHAVDVCQTVFTFIHEGRVAASITRLDEFVLMVTALVHDLDHMGLNNSFHLKTDSPLGMLSSASGNNSVLEVHHCNLAIEILNDPAKDVFKGMDSEQKTHAYRRMIDCVLSTDMQRHNDVVNDFVAIDTFDVSNEVHVSLACKMILKAADISNVTKPFHVSRKWGMSVTEEFYQQGDKEKEKGVAPLPMFDRSLNNELAKGQIGFIDFIAQPFFRKFSDRFVGLRWTIENIESNKAAWTSVLNERSQK